MKLDILKLGVDQIDALDLLISQMLKQWQEAGVKKDTEFDTIWNLAEIEGVKRFRAGLIKNLYDKHRPKNVRDK